MADDPLPTSDQGAQDYSKVPGVLGEGFASSKPAADPLPTLPKMNVEGMQTDLITSKEHEIGERNLLTRQSEARDAQNRQRQERMISAEGATIEELKHGQWNAAAELGKRETSLWEQFGSPGFLIAMMGSAFSATPMNSALAAGGAAMNAINKGKMDDYQRAFEAWKENTNLVIKRAALEHQEYEDIDHLRHTDMAAWTARATAIATKYNDERSLALLRNGMGPEFLEARHAQNESLKTMAEVTPLIEEQHNKVMWITDQLKREGKEHDIARHEELSNEYDRNKAAAKYGVRGADAPFWERAVQMFPGDPQKQAEQVAKWKAEGKNTSSRNPVAMVMQKVKDEGGTSDEIAKAGQQATFYQQKARTMGVRAGQIDPAVEELKKLKPLALAASKKIPRGEWKKWNELEQSVLSGTSSPEMRDFYNYTQGIKNFAQTVMTRGGQNTVDARHRADELISTAESQESYEHAIASLETEANIVKAVVDEMGGGVKAEGGAEKPPSQMSDEELKDALKRRLQDQGGAAKPAHAVPMSQ